MAYMRGALPSPVSKIAAAHPHMAAANVPDSFAMIPKQLSMWANDQYGDCVTAEECAAKAAYSVRFGGTELFIDEQTCINWARQHHALHGADLSSIMDSMIHDGITGPDGKLYHDGPYNSVDWTNETVLRSAIYTGPVKIGIAANDIENAVNSTNGKSGWYLITAPHSRKIDHCVGLWGFGTVKQLTDLMNAALNLGLSVPSGTDGSLFAVLLYTWNSIGIVTHQALVNFTDEAWVRNPTTPEAVPVPDPHPLPPPVPIPPTPTPVPSSTFFSGQFLAGTGFGGHKMITVVNGSITKVE